MSNYTKKIEGLELLYHLIKNREMTYNDAVEEMREHNQDMTFLNKLKIDNNN